MEINRRKRKIEANYEIQKKEKDIKNRREENDTKKLAKKKTDVIRSRQTCVGNESSNE